VVVLEGPFVDGTRHDENDLGAVELDAFVSYDLFECGDVGFDGKMLFFGGHDGVVGAEEDGHEPDARVGWGRRDGGEEVRKACVAHDAVVAGEAPVEDVEMPVVSPGQSGREDVRRVLGYAVTEEEELRVHPGFY